MFDLKSMSFAQLNELRTSLNLEISSRRNEEIAAAKRQIQELARGLGVTVEELLAKSAAPAKKPRSEKYRHPVNKALTWSGFGRKPSWVRDLENDGVPLDQMLNPSAA